MKRRKVKVLLTFSAPRGSVPLRLGTEDRTIRESIQLSVNRKNIELITRNATTIHDLRRALLEDEFEIIHISGHGISKGLILEDELGGQYVVPQKALAELFQTYSPPLKCVVLNACYSVSQGELSSSLGVPFTVAMEGTLDDEAAIEFSRGFYDAIGAGRDIEFAYAEGCRTVKLALADTQFVSKLLVAASQREGAKISELQDQAFARLLTGAISGIAAYEGKSVSSISKELATAAGVDASVMRQYMNGRLPADDQVIAALAAAIVRRAYVNRTWLQKLLLAVRFGPFEKVQRLLNQLYPSDSPIAPLSQVYENLPTPSYPHFVRTAYFASIVEALQYRSALIVITSFGGMGKTCLAREVAAYTLRDVSRQFRFDSVVWTTDKDKPGSTNITTVLDEIARTLDYPGVVDYPHEEKKHEIERLLRRNKVLLVVDNFETITDPALFVWLQHLPEPSKALITSREFRREFRNGAWTIEVKGMNIEEARELITVRVESLQMVEMIRNRADIDILIHTTGGNPLAIEMSLGYIKRARRTFAQIIDDLQSANLSELFDRLFSRCWDLIDDTARTVLMASTLFYDTIDAGGLSYVSGVNGIDYELAIEELCDFALLNVVRPDWNAEARFELHPLVRAFASKKLNGRHDVEEASRSNWLKWYKDLVAAVGYVRNEPNKLHVLDPEQATIHSAIGWANSLQMSSDVLELVRGVSYYYYVRGLWNKQPPINLLAADAAHAIGSLVDEIRFLAYHVQMLGRQGKADEMASHVERLLRITESVAMRDDVRFEYVVALSNYYQLLNNTVANSKLWDNYLSSTTYASGIVGAKSMKASELHAQGRLVDAHELYVEIVSDCRRHGIVRGVISATIKLCEVAIDQGNLDEAEQLVNRIKPDVGNINDRKYAAWIDYLEGRLLVVRNKPDLAWRKFQSALDAFERLGLRREVERIRRIFEESPELRGRL